MGEEGSVGIVETKYLTFAAPPNEMTLECGRTLGPITLAYETYGELNEAGTMPFWWFMRSPGMPMRPDIINLVTSSLVGGIS